MASSEGGTVWYGVRRDLVRYLVLGVETVSTGDDEPMTAAEMVR